MGKAKVFYDAGCRFCTRSKRLGERLDWLGHFEWTPSPTPQGAIVLLDGAREHRGWRAVKRMAAWTPATYLGLAAVAGGLILAGAAAATAAAVCGLALAAVLSPLSNPLGDAAYAWVARNRLRIMGAETCEWKPPGERPR